MYGRWKLSLQIQFFTCSKYLRLFGWARNTWILRYIEQVVLSSRVWKYDSTKCSSEPTTKRNMGGKYLVISRRSTSSNSSQNVSFFIPHMPSYDYQLKCFRFPVSSKEISSEITQPHNWNEQEAGIKDTRLTPHLANSITMSILAKIPPCYYTGGSVICDFGIRVRLYFLRMPVLSPKFFSTKQLTTILYIKMWCFSSPVNSENIYRARDEFRTCCSAKHSRWLGYNRCCSLRLFMLEWEKHHRNHNHHLHEITAEKHSLWVGNLYANSSVHYSYTVTLKNTINSLLKSLVSCPLFPAPPNHQPNPKVK